MEPFRGAYIAIEINIFPSLKISKTMLEETFLRKEVTF